MPIASIDPKDPLKVWECKALPNRGSQEALALLQRIAKQVQPVMRKRGWRVPLLSEFSPKSPNLLGLNINGGGGKTAEIKIRLRPHMSDGSFFPYEHLLGTMLHELVHNVQGPHNAVFYKLLDEITEECEGFMAKGITGSGAGFDAPSMGRLGGRGPVPIHNPPAHQLKSAALKAAEARSKKQSLMSSGPRKIGGDLSMLKSLTPAQAAARAAERRAKDNVWCPCGDNATIVGYTNDDSGVIILDDAKRPHQSSSDAPKPSKPCSSSISQASMPSTSAACSSARLTPQDALLSAVDKHSVSLSHGAQQQHAHVRHVAGATSASCDKHERQPRSALLSQQPQPGGLPHASIPSTKVPSTVARCNPASSSDLVDLTLDDSDALPAHQPKSKRLRYQQHGASQLAQTSAKPASEPGCTLDHAEAAPALWPCSVCTLLNEDLSLQCGACGTVRPAGFQQGHLNTCHPIAHAQSKPQVMPGDDAWECSFCSLVNAGVSSHCSACARWRYSYGAPHASRPTV